MAATAQPLLARLGLRVGIVGSSAALALSIASAADAAARIGFYADTPAGAEVLGVVVGGVTGPTYTRSGSTVAVSFTGSLTMADATNIVLNTTTGTKIGTATSQKLGFFNATPIVQPANTTDLRTALINLGLYASGGASPLDLNGGAFIAGSVTNSALTSGRVPLIGTAGVMQDSAVFTYSTGSQEFRLGDGTAAPAYVVNGASAQNRAVSFRTGNSQRWQIIAGGAAETGVSNAGTSFAITAYDDSAAVIDSPISIVRASGGTITITRPISSSAQITGGNISTTGSAGLSCTGSMTAFAASGTCKINRTAASGVFSVAGDMCLQSDAVGDRSFLFVAGSSAAIVARIDGKGAMVTKQKAGTPSDSDMAVAADGALVVDSSGSKIWCRVGGAWKSVAVA